MASAIIFAAFLSTLVPVLAKIEIRFTKSPEPVTAAIGTTKAFECAVQVPAEKFVWRTFERIEEYKKWRDLAATDGNSTVSRLMVNVTEDMPDSWYQCVVWYGAVTLASVPARLTVARLDISRNSRSKRVVYVPINNDVVLHCKPPISEPPATLTWWKEEQERKIPIPAHYGVLLLKNVSLDDTGMYGCTATNELSGQVKDLPETTYLQVRHGGHNTPTFLETEDYTGTLEGDVLTRVLYPNEPLVLWCGIIGQPQPRVRWTRDNTRHHPGRTENVSQPFIVDPFRIQDEGIYSCSANNLRRAWKVVKYQEPRWDGEAGEVNAKEGHRARVSCGRLQGYPRPTVYWLLNSKPLVPGKGVKITDEELVLERVEKRHAGVVQCMACTDRACGFDAAMLSVVPAEISNPSSSESFPKNDHYHSLQPKKHRRKNQVTIRIPPSRPNVTRMSNDSVMVTWSGPDSGLPVSFFKVQYREISKTNGNSWNTENQDIEPNIHSYLIDGIEPDKYYKFRISAVYSDNDNKQGKTSAKFYLKRGGFDRPNTPSLDSAVAVSPTEILLNWTWSDEGGPKNEGFYVYYRVLSTAGEYNKQGAPAHARALLVTHLQPDVAYEFKLQAYTELAPSNFSAILKAKTQRALAPEVVPTSNNAESAEVPRRGGALVPAAGAVGAALLLAAALSTLLLCRRARRPPLKEKNSRADSSAGNGYIPAKVPITITANPMHNEAGDSSVELSYLHNNNCGNNSVEDNSSHNRKSTNSRNYV